MDDPIWINSSPEHKTLLVTMLLMANHEPKSWDWNGKKFTVNPGEFVTSIDKLKKEAGQGVTYQNTRSALLRFEKLNFLTNESTKSGRLIKIVNWATYQAKDDEDNIDTSRRSTDGQQTVNRQPTTNEEYKNDKNDKKVPAPRKRSAGNPSFTEFRKWFMAEYSKHHDGDKYVFQAAKDGSAIKRMLGSLEIEELKARALRFFVDDDSFPKNEKSIWALAMNVNRYTKKAEPPKPPETKYYEPPPEDVEWLNKQYGKGGKE